MGITVAFTCLVFLSEKARAFKIIILDKKYRVGKIMSLLVIVAVWLYSCNGVPLAGISSDINTGMVTTYSKIKPEESVLVMNEERSGYKNSIRAKICCN